MTGWHLHRVGPRCGARRAFLAAWMLGSCAAVVARTGTGFGDDSAQDKPASSSPPVKRILVCQDCRNPATPALRWLLYDPLILSHTRIVVQNGPMAGGAEADLSPRAMAPYDLVIVATPRRLGKRECRGLLDYLEHGKALLLVEPSIADPELASTWEQRTGIGLEGYRKPTAAFSVTSSHPGARILGLPVGRSVLPHRISALHAKLVPHKAIVLTELGCGEPDLVLSSQTRCGVLATDWATDLTAQRRGDPEFAEYQRNAGLLLVNAVRYLLSRSLFVQPVQTPQQRWSELFQGYGAGREYVEAAQTIEPFHSRLSARDLAARLYEADAKMTLAARALLRGELSQCERLYREAAAVLAQAAQEMIRVNRFLIRGWHASIAFDDYYGGGVLGYAESEWSDHLVHWMRGELGLIQRAGARRLVDIYGHDWQILAKYYPSDVAAIGEAARQGRLEPIHGLYSAAYLPMFSGETNVRQLRYGTEIVRNVLGASVVSYADPADHYDLHPQLPQLLSSFGFRYAFLNGGCELGATAPAHADKVGWRSLDGTVLPAIPRYEGLGKNEDFTNLNLIAQADKLGYQNVLLGWTADATFNHAVEQPHTLLDGAAPVSGKWVTLGEFFQSTPPAQSSRFLGVDELHASNLEKWSSWGCMNEAYGWNRETENWLLAAERFHAVACGKRLVPPKTQAELQTALSDAWKSLLSTQDHMTFGAVDYSRQVPPGKVKPGEEQPAWHAWGYRFQPFPRSVVNTGGMENYAEQGAANYGGPRIPTTRFEKVQQCHRVSREQAERVFDDALGRLVGSGGPPQDPQARAVCVVNSLGAARRDLVTIEASLPPQWARHVQLSDGRGPVESQTIARKAYADGSLESLKLLVPVSSAPLGYQTFVLAPAAAPKAGEAPNTLVATPTKLECPFHLVELDGKHGGVRRIFDKQCNREVLAAGEAFGNELWSPESPAESSTRSAAQIRMLEAGPLRATVEVRSTIGPLPYQCAISLYRDLQRIDFKLAVDYGDGFSFGQFGKSGTGLFLRLPLSVDGKMFINQPFGIYETSAAKQVTTEFAAMEQDGFGIAIIHRNTPCIFRDGSQLRLVLSQGRPLVVGRQIYEYSIVSYTGDLHEANIYGAAQAINTPVRVFWPPAGARAGAHESFLAIDRPNIVLSALLAEGNSIQARFSETAGKATRAHVRWPFPPTECTQISLNGQPVRRLDADRASVELDFRPWEILTISAAKP